MWQLTRPGMIESFSSLLQQIGSRFLLTALPPAMILVLGEATLYRLVVDPCAGPGILLNLAASLLGRVAFWTAVALVALGWLLANQLIVQTWEGYTWIALKARVRRLLRRPGRSAPVPWEERANELGGQALLTLLGLGADDSKQAGLALRAIVAEKWREGGLKPPCEETMPTDLGKILREMEVAPRIRYGIDGVQVWSRLLLVAPPAVAEQYSQSRAWLDLALHVASAQVVLALSAVALLRPTSALGLAGIIVLLLGAYLAYRFSLPFAEAMRMAVDGGFDLYRGHLLKAWGLRQPQSLEEEQRVWRLLQQFEYWGSPYLFPEEYRIPDAPRGDLASSEGHSRAPSGKPTLGQ
jgi:hypothetical protein